MESSLIVGGGNELMMAGVCLFEEVEAETSCNPELSLPMKQCNMSSNCETL